MMSTLSPIKLKKCCSELTAEEIIDALLEGAREELLLTPKPGLVDIYDSGSHDDLDYSMMCKSIGLLRPYLEELAYEMKRGTTLHEARETGVVAEHKMIDECGTNTHKGYIFLSGLFLISALSREKARDGIKDIAEALFEDLPSGTKGAIARKEFGVGGIIKEALEGFPAVFDDALPAFREKFAETGCRQTASILAMARLMQTIEDTTALHRCGKEGLKSLRADGKRIEKLIRKGKPVHGFLFELNEKYKRMNLTMGGVADMLALTFALDKMI